MSTILELANPYHAYVFGTSFWYFIRAVLRLIDPATVCGWFRPNIDGNPTPNALELYTTRNDAWCMLALGAILLAVSDALPLPKGMTGSSLAEGAPSTIKKPYARAIVLITTLHHITTALGIWQHCRVPTHNNMAMDVGFYGNVSFTSLGVVALLYGMPEGEARSVEEKKRI